MNYFKKAVGVQVLGLEITLLCSEKSFVCHESDENWISGNPEILGIFFNKIELLLFVAGWGKKPDKFLLLFFFMLTNNEVLHCHWLYNQNIWLLIK